MGQQIDCDRDRINATGRRLVRGLYYFEKSVCLGSPEDFRVAAKSGITATDPAIQQFVRMYARSADRREETLGDVFSYAVCFFPGISVWLLLLYGYFGWLASTRLGYTPKLDSE